ncbi:MAG: molybdenum cofactor cytidylyltransferase [Rhodobacteraceae bacterium HLUCCA12]|nr:MAG: molybdenum cofactor cytidylyltransferase [Rhodobacteraceae bacterium HLUCCA12]
MSLAVALLAAGASRRMRGGDKLLEPVGTVAVLRHIAEGAVSARVGPVAVTMRPDSHARRAVLAGLDVTILEIAQADEGMAASLRAAARWAAGQGVDGLMICPADMPDLDADDFRALAMAFRAEGGTRPVRAVAADGREGHPVVFPATLLAQFAELAGDRGAQAILRHHPPVAVPRPGLRAVTDLDTPEEWAAWRQR